MVWPLLLAAGGNALNAYGQQQGADALADAARRHLQEEESGQQRIADLGMGLRSSAGVAAAQQMAADPQIERLQRTLAALRTSAPAGASAGYRSALEATQNPGAAMDAAQAQSVLMGPQRAAAELAEQQADVANQQAWERYYLNSLRALRQPELRAAGMQGAGMRSLGNQMSVAGMGASQAGAGQSSLFGA